MRVNRLITPRLAALDGPLMQRVGVRAFVHDTGNYLGVGKPGSGVTAYAGIVVDDTTVQVYFTVCVDISGTTGIELSINEGAWTELTLPVEVSGTVWQFTSTVTIEAGDTLRWRYVGGSDTITDCAGSEDIGDQLLDVDNALMAEMMMLLETGGNDFVLLEDDIDGSAAALTEDSG